MTFTYRYCRMLEEGSFRGKSSDFIMMFLFGGALMTVRYNELEHIYECFSIAMDLSSMGGSVILPSLTAYLSHV